MFVLLDEQDRVLIQEVDIVTNKVHYEFVKPAVIDSINTYRTKCAKLKLFFPWYSFEGDYHLMRKRNWIRKLKLNC